MNKYNEVMDKVKVTDDMRKRILQNIEDTDLDKVSSIELQNAKKKNKIVPFIRKYSSMAAMFAVILVGAYAVFVVLPGRDKSASYSTAPVDTYEISESATESAMEPQAETAAETPGYYAEKTQDTDEFAEDEAEPAMGPVLETMPAVPSAGEVESNGKEAMGSKTESASDAEMAAALEFASAEQLSKEAGTSIKDIESFLNNSLENHYLLYENGMMEIDYFVDGGNIYYRKASEEAASEYVNSDITGEYIDYSVVVKETVNGTEVTLRGTDNSFNVATWTADGYEYSLIHEKGLDGAAFLQVIADILEK